MKRLATVFFYAAVVAVSLYVIGAVIFTVATSIWVFSR